MARDFLTPAEIDLLLFRQADYIGDRDPLPDGLMKGTSISAQLIPAQFHRARTQFVVEEMEALMERNYRTRQAAWRPVPRAGWVITMIRVAVVGYGNIGQYAVQVQAV